MNENDIEDGVEEILDAVDRHSCADSGEASKAQTKEFYQGIIYGLKSRMEALKAGTYEDDEEVEEDE